MSKVISAHAESVDGYITRRDPGRHTDDDSDWITGGGPHPQAAVLLGAGRPFFGALPEHVPLRLLKAVPAPGVTHLHDEVVR